MATQSLWEDSFPPPFAVGNKTAQNLLILRIHELHAAYLPLGTLEMIRKHTLCVGQSTRFLKDSLDLLNIFAAHMLLAVILKEIFHIFRLHSPHIHIEDRLFILRHVRSDILSEEAFLKEIITAVAKNFSASESKDLSLILPEKLRDALEPFVSAELGRILGAGVKAEFSSKVSGGFVIGPADGGYRISLTDETFKELIAAYLRPTTRKLLFG